MKCPNDGVEMIKGSMFAMGQFWIEKLTWLTKFYLGLGVKGKRVYAWKCPECGKIELRSEE